MDFSAGWKLNTKEDSLPGSCVRAIEPRGGCMLRRYETIFIMKADLQSDEMSNQIDRYSGIIKSLDGTVVKAENWGKRRLAYLIEKRREGVYIRIDFVARYTVVTEVERNFKIDDNVIRFQTVKLSDKVNMEEIETEIADALKKEEELKIEEQRKEDLKREEELKTEKQAKEDLKREEAVSETAAEGAESPEEPDDKDSENGDDDVAHEASPLVTDKEGAEEE